MIRRVAELHLERAEELATIIQREMGKPHGDGVGEVEFTAAIYSYYADNAEKFLADEPMPLLDGEGSAVIRRWSVGALLGIMPWNYPYYQVARFAGPNLVLGNTVLLKHAPQCPESAAAIAEIFREAGCPEGAYVNIYATNEQVADDHRRPADPGGVADRLRAGRCRRRRDRRPEPEEGGAGARWVGPVRAAEHRRPGRHDRGRGGRPAGEHRPGLQRGQAVHRGRRPVRHVHRAVHREAALRHLRRRCPRPGRPRTWPRRSTGRWLRARTWSPRASGRAASSRPGCSPG